MFLRIKKYKIFLLVIIPILFMLGSFLIINNEVNATSGTCSSHGGINCDAGSDWDGSTICNDGWCDSSEQYSSAIMCRDMLCTTLEYSNLKLRYNITELKSDISKIDSEMSLLNAEYWVEYNKIGSIPMTTNRIIGEQNKLTRNYQSELSSLESSRNLAVSSYNLAIGSLNSECTTLGRDRYNRYVDDASIKYANYINSLLSEYKEKNEIYNYINYTTPIVLGDSITNNLNLQSGWLIKNRQYAEVFYVNQDLCLQWIMNEQIAEKHFGKTWNYEGNIKEYETIPKGYKFCDTLK
jgi:hypothetical protein